MRRHIGAFLCIMIYCAAFALHDAPSGQIGNPSLPPVIRLLEPQAGAMVIQGSTANILFDSVRVVVWARADHWYVQPSAEAPLTVISRGGTWSCGTHPWSHVVALLVGPNYQAGTERYEHPSTDLGVLAWDEFPSSRLEFSGYQWIKKSGDGLGPGPNAFSDSSENIWTDSLGLHLRITKRGQKWYCPEVLLDHSLGFGTYTYCLDSRVDSLDISTIFSGFSYESLQRELDIEWTRAWTEPPDNMQYVVQPWNHSGNMIRFVMPPAIRSTHRFVWIPERVKFTSWAGWDSIPNPSTLIKSWSYTGTDVPPHDHERMRFNLWLFNGRPPVGGTGDEVVVHSFHFSPMSLSK